MILILGGTGETGSWFACYFKEKGFDVVVKAGRCSEMAAAHPRSKLRGI